MAETRLGGSSGGCCRSASMTPRIAASVCRQPWRIAPDRPHCLCAPGGKRTPRSRAGRFTASRRVGIASASFNWLRSGAQGKSTDSISSPRIQDLTRKPLSTFTPQQVDPPPKTKLALGRARVRIAPGPEPAGSTVRFAFYEDFCAAQRRLTASAIRFLPSGEITLFLVTLVAFAATDVTEAAFLGLPGFCFVVGTPFPLSKARASWRVDISLSIVAKISDTAMCYSPSLKITTKLLQLTEKAGQVIRLELQFLQPIKLPLQSSYLGNALFLGRLLRRLERSMPILRRENSSVCGARKLDA